jgi:hypothetical protein
LERAPFAHAMSEPRFKIAMKSQTVRCSLYQEGGKPYYVVEVELEPKVTFENGKATEATINWGDASAPMLNICMAGGLFALADAGPGASALDNWRR